MKLVVMIPCLNEEATLPLVFATMPKSIPGIDEIEILVIDDGCTDRTVEVAKEFGVKQFVYHTRNQGMSRAVKHGLSRALELGADVIAMTEGDNQYPQERIPDLVRPILEGKADVVIGDRQTQTIEHFSATTKFFQKFGTWVLNRVAGTNVPDAITGFRAWSREAALALNPIANFSWATETTIQASRKRQAIMSIPIKTGPKLRESRNYKSKWQHIRKSSITIVRGLVTYNSYAVFFTLGVIMLIGGLIPFIHYIFAVFFTPKTAYGSHHLQSLIIGAVILTASFISFTLGVVADMISVNRALLEDILTEAKRSRFDATRKRKEQ
ncbi:MAG TPA: glycosyltransferase family 2 protein [Candidatus Saccharimonadia bacterium]|nr:glycosyltransferase family 2 protein [Candidatus Saccharimonadia bacterium]